MSSKAGNAGESNEVSVTSDGLVQKTIVTEGDGDPAGRGAKVTIKYTLRRTGSAQGDDDVIDSSDRRPNGTLTFTQGRKKVISALDVVVPTMRRGEIAKATVAAPYAFGARGLPRKKVAPNSSILLEVEMIDFSGGEVKKTIKEMTPRERFEEAKVCKEAGNVLFKVVKYEKAMRQYSQCIRYAANVFYKPEASEDHKDSTGDDSAKETVTKSPDNTAETTEDDDKGFTEATITEGNEVIETLDVSTATSGLPEEHTDSEKSSEVSHANGTGLENKEDSEEKDGNGVQATNGHESNTVNATESKAEGDQDGRDDPTVEEVSALHVTALNNLSLCLVKMEQYKQAVETATMALQIDPQSSKAFFYRYVIPFCNFSCCDFPILVHSQFTVEYLTLSACFALETPTEDAHRLAMESGIKRWKISKRRNDCSPKIWVFVWKSQSSRKSVKAFRILRKSKRQRCLRRQGGRHNEHKRDHELFTIVSVRYYTEVE